MATIQLNKKNEKIVRKNYSKVSGSAPLPNLVEIQTESYKQFLLEGIKEGFKDIYPIKGPNGNLELLYPDVAIRLATGLVVIILMILFPFPELFSRAKNRIHFMSHGTE